MSQAFGALLISLNGGDVAMAAAGGLDRGLLIAAVADPGTLVGVLMPVARAPLYEGR